MKILIYPHEILKKKADPVEKIDGELQKVIDEMLETMYAAAGVGLAANQVGLLQQIVVMDAAPAEDGRSPIILLNPRIVASEDDVVEEEGCLSVPGYASPVKRAARVQVAGYDREGREVGLEADGLLARCIQHELDHLEGICFVDRLSSLKKTLFRKKWARIRPEER